jgi:hypothetical protein
LIEHDGEDLRHRPFLDRKAALAQLLRRTKAGILLNEHVADDGPTVFAHACRLGAEGIVSKRVDGTYQSGPCRVWIKVRDPASTAVQRERSEIWNRRRSGSARRRLHFGRASGARRSRPPCADVCDGLQCLIDGRGASQAIQGVSLDEIAGKSWAVFYRLC